MASDKEENRVAYDHLMISIQRLISRVDKLEKGAVHGPSCAGLAGIIFGHNYNTDRCTRCGRKGENL